VKIREIDIENFGIFTDRHFDFGEAPFQLIHGPNEAGKSTLLHLLRQLLFGFPGGSSPYLIDSHSGEMAARALIDVSDGRRISFRRRKGRKGTVVGEVEGTAEKINDNGLNDILGNASIDLYQHVFGFSLTELSRGEESLKHANLNEAMFSGSLGSPSNLQEIQKSLEDETGLLFLPKGQRTINKLLSEISSRKKEVKEATLKPREFEDKEKALGDAEELVASLSDSREKLQKERAHLDRLCRAVEPLLERKTTQEELDQIEIPEGVTSTSGAELQRLQDDILRASASLDEASEELSETKRKLNILELSPEILKVEARIRSLEKDFRRIQRDQELIPQLHSESETILAEVNSRLAGLNPDWDCEYLAGFRSSLEQREKLDELANRWSQLETQRAELTARRPDLKQRVENATERLAELKNVESTPELDAILEREPEYRGAVATLAESSETQASVVNQLATLRKRLAPLLVNTDLPDDELAELPLPLESLIRSFQDRLASAEDAVARADSNQRQIAQTLNERRTELETRAAAAQVPDRSQLDGQRERRDAGWNLIRRKFLSDCNSEAATNEVDQEIERWGDRSSESLPDIYEREVSETDRLADDRQAKAKEVAIRDRLLAETGQLEQSLDKARTDRELRQGQLDEVTQEWHVFLSGFSVQPHPPEVILEWHRTFESWLEHRTNLIDSQTRSRQLETQIADFEKLLNLHSPTSPEQSEDEVTVSQKLAVLRRRVDQDKAAQLERSQIEKSLPTDQEALRMLDKDEAQLNDRQSEWSREWATLSDQFGFAADWSVRFATKMLQELHDARQKLQESNSAAERAENLDEDVTRFHKESRSICIEVASDLTDFPLSDMVQRLSERLSNAAEADREQTSLQQDQRKSGHRVESCQNEITELSNRIDSILKAAELSSAEEFLNVARQAQRQQELLTEHASLSRDLKRTAGAEDFERFLSELGSLDTDTLQLKLAELERQHHTIETQRDEALRLESEAKTALQAMDGTSKAAALQLEQEGSYAQLGTAVDRFAPLVLAQTLLKRAIDRFEKEHQPAMLAEVGRLLSRMTGGRYVSIRRRLDEAGTMLIEQQNGKLKTPAQLSTGTREQLYLAIRLAYVQHYCQESEPLPLIMDDILVNFDEQRAQNTLEVLFELPSSIQVLFLTCHEHIATRVGQMRPDLVPIELSPA
jgi:uncharacterized protein YhaN